MTTLIKDNRYRKTVEALLSSTDISDSLLALIHSMAAFAPVSGVSLHLFDSNIGVVDSVAIIEGGKTTSISQWTAVSTEIILANIPDHNYTLLHLDNLIQHPLLKPLSESCSLTGFTGSILLVRLDAKRLGALILCYSAHELPSEAFVNLLASLAVPVTFLLSTTFQHRQFENIQEMLTEDKRIKRDKFLNIANFTRVVGASGGLRSVMAQVQKVLTLDYPVLLTGETGTGKDVIAHTIYEWSSRRNGPFIKINCGAIAENLIESELFGHEHGAFTGTVAQHRGCFERANGGTLFLDEISELPINSQTRFLHVLQDHVIKRVGSGKSLHLDIRIIAATNRDLAAMVRHRQFRQDLFFRLNVFPIRLPPLRERPADIPELVRHFINKKCNEMKLPNNAMLDPGALEELIGYEWPGNVRELENAIAHALISNPQGPLSFPFLFTSNNIDVDEYALHLAKRLNISKFDETISRHLLTVMQQVDGRVEGPGGAAEILGVKPSTLRKRMRKLGIAFGRAYKNQLTTP
ncbi:MAG: sigma 54-interacting transcriptional regulator [Deltaproteobacteria bacterium]|nr:sigma 54-interacting transcriptional regulator [Deltaproteobacteria bacterium]